MAKIRLELYEAGARAATITVPAWTVKAAACAMPRFAGRDLARRVDLDQIAEMAKHADGAGVVLDIQDHEANDRLVISIVGDEETA